jgi:hypothetical protein
MITWLVDYEEREGRNDFHEYQDYNCHLKEIFFEPKKVSIWIIEEQADYK